MSRAHDADRAGYFRRPRFEAFRTIDRDPQTLERFDSGHGWAPTQAGAAAADDTVEYVTGSQSVKLTTDGDGTSGNLRSAVTWDLSGSVFVVVRLKVDRPDLINPSEGLTLDLASDAGYVNFYRVPLGINSQTPRFLRPGEWEEIRVALGSEFIQAGAPVASGIVSAQIRVDDDAAGPVAVWVDHIGTEAQAVTGATTIEFDDGWSSVWDVARPILEDAGLRASVNVIADLVDAPGRLTAEQLRILEDVYGWDVLLHSSSIEHHAARYTGLAMSTLDELLRGRAAFLNLDVGRRGGWEHLSYPGGQWDSDVLDDVGLFAVSGRTINEETLEALPPLDPLRLHAISIIDTDPTSKATDAAAAAEARGSWAILVFHKIVASPAASTEYATADFQTIVDDLVSNSRNVRPRTEVLA